MIKKVLFVLICCLLAFGTFAQPAIGKNAAEISLPDVNGKKISLSSFKGKVVLVDFWASWCHPCRLAVPGLKKLYSLYHDKGFEIVSVSLDENLTDWKKAIATDDTNWTHIIDKSGSIADQWTISMIPTTFLLDKNGKIIAINEDPKVISREVAKALN